MVSGTCLDDLGDIRLDGVGDVRHDVERNWGGRCHRGMVSNHRLTIKPLDDAKVDLPLSKSVEVQLPVILLVMLGRRMLKSEEVCGRTFGHSVHGAIVSLESGGKGGLLELDDGLVGEVEVGLDGRDDRGLDEVDAGVVKPLRRRTNRLRTALELSQLFVELCGLEVTGVRVHDIRNLNGVRKLEILGLTGRSRLGGSGQSGSLARWSEESFCRAGWWRRRGGRSRRRCRNVPEPSTGSRT